MIFVCLLHYPLPSPIPLSSSSALVLSLAHSLIFVHVQKSIFHITYNCACIFFDKVLLIYSELSMQPTAFKLLILPNARIVSIPRQVTIVGHSNE